MDLFILGSQVGRVLQGIKELQITRISKRPDERKLGGVLSSRQWRGERLLQKKRIQKCRAASWLTKETRDRGGKI